MSLTVSSGFSSPLGTLLIVQTAATATPDNDITGGTNLTLNAMEAVNGSSAVCYVKLYAGATATVGTDAPELIFPVAAGTTRTLNIVGTGHVFVTGICLAAVTTAGTGGTNTPTGGNVKVSIITT
jgi:hypothetical protein|tara:strand:- start:541 stop:915 length:375 start_codon:yes stop_codon:yes gene_type:complete